MSHGEKMSSEIYIKREKKSVHRGGEDGVLLKKKIVRKPKSTVTFFQSYDICSRYDIFNSHHVIYLAAEKGEAVTVPVETHQQR